MQRNQTLNQYAKRMKFPISNPELYIYIADGFVTRNMCWSETWSKDRYACGLAEKMPGIHSWESPVLPFASNTQFTQDGFFAPIDSVAAMLPHLEPICRLLGGLKF